MSGIIGHTMYAMLGAQAAAARRLPVAPLLRRHWASYLCGAYLGCDIQTLPEAVCVDTLREVGYGTVPLEKSPLTGLHYPEMVALADKADFRHALWQVGETVASVFADVVQLQPVLQDLPADGPGWDELTRLRHGGSQATGFDPMSKTAPQSQREHAGDLTIVDPKAGPDAQAFARQVSRDSPLRDPWAFSEDCFMAALRPTLVVLNGTGLQEKIFNQKLLALCAAGKARLKQIKRFDMPGFVPPNEWVREMQRYDVKKLRSFLPHPGLGRSGHRTPI